MANVFVTIAKGIEVGGTDAYNWLTKAQSVANSKAPNAIAALAILAESVEKSLADTSAAAANPAALALTLPVAVNDFKADWADVKTLLSTFGITVK